MDLHELQHSILVGTMENREAQRAVIRRLQEQIDRAKGKDQIRIMSDRNRKIIELFKRNQNDQTIER
jgi:hypothetical protein